jgi:dipeptidase E
MKFYLSSHKIGGKAKALKRMFSANPRVGYVPNALDYTKVDLERRAKHIKSDIENLEELGLAVELLDLKDYFGKRKGLENKLSELGGIWVTGGNVFILRQAMRLSGLDVLLKRLADKKDFVYAGYSAGGGVLSPDLHVYEMVDDATDMPYRGQKKVIWKGLGLIDYAFMPHYKSDHPETENIGKEVDYCKKHKLPYRALSDGEVIIIE